MKKTLYFLFTLLIMMISICACSNTEEDLLDYHQDSIESSNQTDNQLEKQDSQNLQQENVESQNSNETSSNKVNSDKQNSETSNSGEQNPNTQATIQTQVAPVATSSLSNQKCAWGFRRMKDGVRPEFTASYTKPLDDYDGIYCGNSGEKIMYLTFDEGYENGYTTTILDTLKEKEVSATFFVTMPYVKQNPDLIQRMIDEGHIVGNHTVNHPSMPEVMDDEKLKQEILGLHDYVKEHFDYEMKFLRPPKGEYSERTVAISKELGYRTVLWSSAYADWDVKNQKGTDYAQKMILNYLHNGCVMLLHAVSKDNNAVLGEVIDEIQERGFEIRSLEDFE